MRSAYIVKKANAKREAIKKGIPFEKYWGLTFEQFEKFAIKTKLLTKRGKKPDSYSIDRRNALHGYFDWNIQCMEFGDNCAKGSTLDRAILKSYFFEEGENGTGSIKVRRQSLDEIDAPF